MQDFVGRFELMRSLWQWLIFENRPRIYLHGPGGSGKSTLAYEFARSVADTEVPISFVDGQTLDYVLFLSGKETAFNPLTLREHPYLMQAFSDSEEQFAQILYHSGLLGKLESKTSPAGENDRLLTELMDNFSGLIVLDDIDALSRRNVDTGEEMLFFKAATAKRRTKILYTLRFAPAYALATAMEVPSLRYEDEFFAFLEACAAQFGVPPPNAQEIQRVEQETDRLPLLIETVIGLRKSCSRYADALEAFAARRGDAARRYLYQREYDKLDPRGKARHLLAALVLIGSPVASDTLRNILNMSPDQVRDAIAETRGIFLRTEDNAEGETLYEVASPAITFVNSVSAALEHYPAIERAVQQFRNDVVRMTQGEASLVSRLALLVRSREIEEALALVESVAPGEVIRGNRMFLGLAGQVYSWSGWEYAEAARECFRQAYALHNKNVFMLRVWYNLELRGEHTLDAAERICRSVISDDSFANRYRSEFYSKLGQVLEVRSRSHFYTDRERAISLLQQSLNAYLKGAWLSQDVYEMGKTAQMEWITQTALKLFRLLRDDVEPLFSLIEGWGDTGHDVDVDAARALLEPLRPLATVAAPERLPRIAGLCRRSMGRLSRLRSRTNGDGFAYVLSTLRSIMDSIEQRRMDQGRMGAAPVA